MPCSADPPRCRLRVRSFVWFTFHTAAIRRAPHRLNGPARSGDADPSGPAATPDSVCDAESETLPSKISYIRTQALANGRRGAIEMTATARDRCEHCGSAIIDPTTRVIHGPDTYCCPNCAAAVEQRGAGSDPEAGRYENTLRCAHCNAAIVDEATMAERGDQAFCCKNCAAAMAVRAASSARQRAAAAASSRSHAMDAIERSDPMRGTVARLLPERGFGF